MLYLKSFISLVSIRLYLKKSVTCGLLSPQQMADAVKMVLSRGEYFLWVWFHQHKIQIFLAPTLLGHFDGKN